MFRGFYTVGSGMIAQQRRTEMLANNMANINTPGFKAEQSVTRSFPDMYMARRDAVQIPTEKGLHLKGLTPIGPVSTGVYMQETLPLFTQGLLQETELTTDMALLDGELPTDPETGSKGAIFYRLEHPDGGEHYTKNGNFSLDANGYLTHPLGFYVLGQNGQRIQLTSDDFQVSPAGVIRQNDVDVVALSVAFAPQPDRLIKQGVGLFRTENGQPLQESTAAENVSYTIQQGFLEGSNVDAARTMTDMLTAYRAFEANQKILQAYDRSMEKAVTEVGRVN